MVTLCYVCSVCGQKEVYANLSVLLYEAKFQLSLLDITQFLISDLVILSVLSIVKKRILSILDMNFN